ncbi:MAG: hypothetical protein R2865_06925 [Deinococcales bacterium]
MHVPIGWQVMLDEANGTLLIEEDPNDPLAASLLLMVLDNSMNISPRDFIATFMEQSGMNQANLIEENTLDDSGGLMQVVEGIHTGVTARFALYSSVDTHSNSILLAVFAAPSEHFENLGGKLLAPVVFFGVDPNSHQEASQLEAALSQEEMNLFSDTINKSAEVLQAIAQWYEGQIEPANLASYLSTLSIQAGIVRGNFSALLQHSAKLSAELSARCCTHAAARGA